MFLFQNMYDFVLMSCFLLPGQSEESDIGSQEVYSNYFRNVRIQCLASSLFVDLPQQVRHLIIIIENTSLGLCRLVWPNAFYTKDHESSIGRGLMIPYNYMFLIFFSLIISIPFLPAIPIFGKFQNVIKAIFIKRYIHSVLWQGKVSYFISRMWFPEKSQPWPFLSIFFSWSLMRTIIGKSVGKISHS